MKLILINKDQTYFVQAHFFHTYVEYKKQDFLHQENLSMWKMKGAKNTIMMCYKESRLTDILRYKNIFRGKLTTQKVETIIIPKIKAICKEYGQLSDDGNIYDDVYISQNNRTLHVDKELKYNWLYNYKCLNMDAIAKPYLHFNSELSPYKKIELAFNAIGRSLNYRNIVYAVLESKNEKITYVDKEVNYGN